MTFFKKIWSNRLLPGQEKTLKTRAVRLLAFLLLFLFLFYILSGVSAAMTTPIVSTEKPKRGAIVHKTTLEGTLKAEGSVPVVVKEGVIVMGVDVQPGDTVAAGQLLFRYDTTELKQTIAQKEVELRRSQVEYSTAKKNRAVLKERQSNTVESAENSYDNQLTQADLRVKMSGEELAQAKRAVDQAGRTKKSTGNSGGGIQAGYSGGQQLVPESVGSEGSGGSGGSGGSENSGSSGKTEEEQLREAYRLKQIQYDQAVAERRATMEKADRDIRDSKLVDVEATVELLGLDIQLKQMELSILRETVANDGQVLAPVGGIVAKLDVELGKRTPNTSAVDLADDKGLLFESELSKEQMKHVTREDPLDVKLTGESKAVENLPIQSIRPIEDKPDTYKMSCVLPKGVGMPGQGASATVSQKSETFEVTVPLSALYDGGNGKYYVYIIEEQASIMGSVQVAKKVDVTVSDKNDKTVAVSGAVSDSDQVVISSDRQLQDGSKIRIGGGGSDGST